MKSLDKNKRVGYVLVLFLSAIIYQRIISSPKGIDFYRGMDTVFHLGRIVGLSNVFQSPVNFTTFAHHGTMMNVFYPWLTLYPAYLLYAVSHNLVLAWSLFSGLITATTALVAFYSFLSIRKNNAAAFLFSILYTFSAYHTANMYLRSAIGETIAMAFLPLMFAGVYHILRGKWQKWPLLTFGMTLVVYSHLLSLVLNAAFILIFIVLSLHGMDHRKERAVAMVKAALMTVLMSLPALVPMIVQSSKDALLTPTAPTLYWIQSPQALFTNIVNNNIAMYTPGLLLAFIAIWLIARFNRLELSDRVILIVALLTFVATSTLFPWHLFNWLPMYKLQFATRFNTYITLFIVFVFANNVTARSTKHSVWVTGAFLVVSILMTSTAVHQLRNSTFRPHTTITQQQAVTLGRSYPHPDYGNADVKKHYEIYDKYLFLLNGKKVNAQYHYDANTYNIRVQARTAGTLVTPLFRYTGQKLTLNDKRVSSSLSKYGTTTIKIPQGTSKIQITYHYSLLAKLCAIIAILSFFGFSGGLIWRRRRVTSKEVQLTSSK